VIIITLPPQAYKEVTSVLRLKSETEMYVVQGLCDILQDFYLDILLGQLSRRSFIEAFKEITIKKISCINTHKLPFIKIASGPMGWELKEDLCS
jgi:hypothetical protein